MYSFCTCVPPPHTQAILQRQIHYDDFALFLFLVTRAPRKRESVHPAAAGWSRRISRILFLLVSNDYKRR